MPAGRLAAGQAADIVFLDLHAIHWMPLNDPANQVVLTEDGTGVRDVMVGGRVVVRNGRHVGTDLAALALQAEAARAEMVEAHADGRYLAQALEQAVGRFCIGLCRQPFHLHRYGGPLGL